MKMNEQQNQSRSKAKVVGNYRLGKNIGTGTFATVREAIHLPTQQKVAIKILHKKLIVDSKDKINVSRQLRIIKQLRHPNIAQLFQIMETKAKIYLVMENVSGGQLYQLIIKNQKNRLDEHQASCFFQQLLNAIEYLHLLGVTHRDLKPENILISNNGCGQVIKLIDFGLSNLYQAGEQLTTACGSPCYAAPQILVQSAYDPQKVDLWSCGIVLYTMLCGFLPFQHQNPSQIYNLIKFAKYELPNHLSAHAQDLLTKMLQINPKDRLKISQIRNHPFCRSFIQPISKGIFANQKIQIQSELVEEMKSLGFSGFIQDIQENQVNSNTATYYVLLYKLMKQRKISSITYFDKLAEVKQAVRSKSITIKRYERQNPQELPRISRNNVISMSNIMKEQNQKWLQNIRTRLKTNNSIHLNIRKI